MVHPIFSVLVSRPELLVDHFAGYAALARDEASSVGIEMAKRAIAWAVAVLAAAMFLVLGGVAIMLGAMHGAFHPALVIVPGIALAISVAAGLVARKRLPEKAFSELKAQLEADADALRAIAAKP
ncbi:MAG: phage holin family protein [Burkholderiales bacterium]|nr:phage holin family protein [Burkholderiales bacterium]